MPTDKSRGRVVPSNPFIKYSNQPTVQYEKPIKATNDFIVVTTSAPDSLVGLNPYGYDMINGAVEFKNETYDSFSDMFSAFGESFATKTYTVDKNDGDPSAGQINPALAVSYEFYSFDGFATFQFRRPPDASCSAIRLTFSIDGTVVLTSPWVEIHSPTQTPVYRVWAGGIGSHTLKVQPEGRFGGCNLGAIIRWGGTVEVQDSS